MSYPRLRFAHKLFAIKNEDRLFWWDIPKRKFGERSPKYSIFCVVDGHNGDDAGKFLEDRMQSTLDTKLPVHWNGSYTNLGGRKFSRDIIEALATSFEELEREWSIRNKESGCCVTVVVVCGWLVTVANIGDALAYIHCKGCVASMTRSHRISGNACEVKRLKSQGVQVAGVTLANQQPNGKDKGIGPLRAWPGGLAIGRSFGDCEMSSAISCRPHVKQIVVPSSHGARLIVASDGLWDSIRGKRTIRRIKTKPVEVACEDLMLSVEASGGYTDDTTVLVLDIVDDLDPEQIKSPIHPKTSTKMKLMRTILRKKKSKLELHDDVDSLMIQLEGTTIRQSSSRSFRKRIIRRSTFQERAGYFRKSSSYRSIYGHVHTL